MTSASKIAGISAASAIILAACGNPGETGSAQAAETDPEKAAVSLAGWGDASAAFVNTDGEKAGDVAFKQTPHSGVLVRVSLSGLSEGWHGVHLHQVGDCSDGAEGFKASGSHIDPEDKAHGLLNPDGPEAADMPNIYAGADGLAVASILNPMVSMDSGGPLADEDGFAVIVHANPDDHMAQPIGGAGSRVACAAVALGE
ncbi:superoxide dismutase family protein [Hyphococcus luteus]|uniref:Superoxide dismutase [Cu-Zn] n=1 Tax=Hyphococcus luteus TaxID=2058213 RepID=A0A2S7K2W4_9PROT|nr:superoxide dismutase family protein [Marinicaulis flavus]PQA86821.1 superoxide dismutase [Marinicaulis flavus]